jgi:hypothetical protein
MNEPDAVSATTNTNQSPRQGSGGGGRLGQRASGQSREGDRILTSVKSVAATSRFPVPDNLEEFIPHPGERHFHLLFK